MSIPPTPRITLDQLLLELELSEKHFDEVAKTLISDQRNLVKVVEAQTRIIQMMVDKISNIHNVIHEIHKTLTP